MIRVLIFTPRKGEPTEEYLKLRENLMIRQALGEFPDYRFSFEMMSGMSVNMARNCGAHLARSNGFDKLLFLDMDVLPTVENILRIVSHDVAVVGGLYTKKNGQGSWLGRHCGNVEMDPKTGLVPYEDLPTGFLCIDVHQCLEIMVEKMPEIEFDAVDDPDAKQLQYSTMHEFFPMGITGPSSWREKFEDIKQALEDYECIKLPCASDFLAAVQKILRRNTGPRIFRGEDYHFCWLCRKLGIPIYADWKCFVHHKGTAVYPLDPQFVLNLADKIKGVQTEKLNSITQP